MSQDFDYDRAIYLIILLVVAVVLNRGAFSRARDAWRRMRDKGKRR